MLARYRNPLSVTWFQWAVNNTTYFKLKITLVGGYSGMSGYWNEYGTRFYHLSDIMAFLQFSMELQAHAFSLKFSTTNSNMLSWKKNVPTHFCGNLVYFICITGLLILFDYQKKKRKKKTKKIGNRNKQLWHHSITVRIPMGSFVRFSRSILRKSPSTPRASIWLFSSMCTLMAP